MVVVSLRMTDKVVVVLHCKEFNNRYKDISDTYNPSLT